MPKENEYVTELTELTNKMKETVLKWLEDYQLFIIACELQVNTLCLSDLNHLPSRAALTAQLYTQTTLYPVLNKVPIYNIAEWNQYYQDAVNYKQDKRELECE